MVNFQRLSAPISHRLRFEREHNPFSWETRGRGHGRLGVTITFREREFSHKFLVLFIASFVSSKIRPNSSQDFLSPTVRNLSTNSWIEWHIQSLVPIAHHEKLHIFSNPRRIKFSTKLNF